MREQAGKPEALKAVREFLESLGSRTALERLLVDLHGLSVLAELPPREASLSVFCFELTLKLAREGLLDRDWFVALQRQYPARESDVDTVAELCGVSIADPIPTGAHVVRRALGEADDREFLRMLGMALRRAPAKPQHRLKAWERLFSSKYLDVAGLALVHRRLFWVLQEELLGQHGLFDGGDLLQLDRLAYRIREQLPQAATDSIEPLASSLSSHRSNGRDRFIQFLEGSSWLTIESGTTYLRYGSSKPGETRSHGLVNQSIRILSEPIGVTEMAIFDGPESEASPASKPATVHGLRALALVKWLGLPYRLPRDAELTLMRAAHALDLTPWTTESCTCGFDRKHVLIVLAGPR